MTKAEISSKTTIALPVVVTLLTAVLAFAAVGAKAKSAEDKAEEAKTANTKQDEKDHFLELRIQKLEDNQQQIAEMKELLQRINRKLDK